MIKRRSFFQHSNLQLIKKIYFQRRLIILDSSQRSIGMPRVKSMKCEDAEYAVCVARRQLEVRQTSVLIFCVRERRLGMGSEAVGSAHMGWVRILSILGNEIIFIINKGMKIYILTIIALLLLGGQAVTWPNTLCITCSVNITATTCVKCQSTGCAAYTSFDSATGQCSCKSGYYMNNANANAIYCDRCFIGCTTCSGPLATNCLSCSSTFVFNSSTSTCTAPSSANDYTQQQAYYFMGFNAVSGWSPTTVTTCTQTTLLGLTSGTFTITLSSLVAHFEVRVLFAHYLQASSANTNIVIGYDGVNTNVPVATNLAGSNNPTLSCGTFITTFVDSSAAHTASSISITISTNSLSFGLRESFVILKLCNGACTSCNGYYASNCTGCADPNRMFNHTSSTTNFTGSCVCVDTYYEQPTAKTCTQLCPALPLQTFGDNNTRTCVASCPNNSYAYTDQYKCLADCPVTSAVTGSLLFKDNIYRRCVPNCPSEAPYALKNTTYRTCYAVCPNKTNIAGQDIDFYAVNGLDPECVSVCPYNASFWLFGYQGNCIPRCPSGTFGDPDSKLCVTNCSSVAFLYKDNSTGLNVCVTNCSGLNYFRDNSTLTCVLTCPDTLFGQTTRECVSRCANGTFGLPFGNRKCVAYCPQGWWGQPDANICVNTTAECKTTTTNTSNSSGYYRYADNYTRTCVFPWQCSFGYYADNLTQTCVPKCPNSPTPAYVTNASVGYINSVCQITCQSPYFADYAAGLCVTACLTNGTYTDVSSGRTCVTACNSSGTTPWADNTTWTCVSVCNSTTIPTFISDNSTYTCVYYCPENRYADRITSNNPTCRITCLNNTYADNSTGTGTCEFGCSAYPPRFGDPTAGLNQCVTVCTPPLFGDNTGLRLCVTQCPSGFYSQNDTTRQCVTRCKAGTYASGYSCMNDPKDCPAGQYANDDTNKCDYCNASLGTWGDPVSKRCVTVCPLNPAFNSSTPATTPNTYYADVSVQLCVLTCNATYTSGSDTGLFGNNNTRSCVFKCSDLNTYAKIGGFRVCVARCYPFDYFANNETRTCVTSINCPTNQFGQNTTQSCVSTCPSGSWAYNNISNRLCIDICPLTWFADNSTGRNICVQNCPALPSLFADSTTKLCVAQCPISGGITYFSDPTTRTCVEKCPTGYYAHTPNRTCVLICPTGYFGLNATIGGIINGSCVTPSSACGTGLVADPYLNLCVTLCTGPTPVSLFAHNYDCIPVCPSTYYSNTHNGVRNCIQLCPPSTIDSVATPNLYGDNGTQSCVQRCVTPLRWADPHTRICEAVCSSTASPPLFSQNFNFTCVTALNCPTTPSMTFGDNDTRSCVTNCSLGKFGHPVTRYCQVRCQNASILYYSDISTGQYLCVPICPILPSLFGYNSTNTCVSQCPAPLFGDQTGNRTCLAVCPLIGSTVHFAQNQSRICVTVCVTGTWGNTGARQCVQTPWSCYAQWADNSTNLCVDVCPASVGTFADPTTKFCVPLCPNSPNLYFSDYSTRTCVQTCPSSVLAAGTFGNNETRACEAFCSPLANGTITYADPQTAKRYCVTQCSQSPHQSFADPSSRTCVSICPTTPDLYGQTTNFTCVAACANGTYADTNTRTCNSSCGGGLFKQLNPNVCVAVCPANLGAPLYGDTNTGFCAETCSNNYFRYKTLSICVSSCTTYSLYSFNMTCVKFCPSGYYANSSGVCVTPCPNTTYGDNSTTVCQTTCTTGYGYNNLCLAICPNGYYGQNHLCVSSCQVSGNSASNVTNTCISNCTNGTYSESNSCVVNCTSGNYADPLTNMCSSSCSNSLYFGNPLTNTCVKQCPVGYYIYGGFCKTGCTGANFADNVTWSCTGTCSTGYWGHNNLCITICPSGYYAYLSDRICYSTTTLPTTIVMFADNVTQTWVSACPLNPLAFADTTLRYCVPNCLGSTLGDPSTGKCESSCKNSSYFADSVARLCVLVCPLGFFANTNNNKCQSICTNGYAYSLKRTCEATCPNPYSGYYNGSANICVQRCPTDYYSFNRICGTTCTSPYYADNTTNQCVLSCVNSYASNDTWICVPGCASFSTYKIADNSTNQCVSICPSQPDYYAENNICVFKCAPSTFADPTSGVRKCTTLCTTGLFSNPLSGRCEATCPIGYWGQNISSNTNRCEPVCTNGFADNSTGLCVSICPNSTYADPTTARCVKMCPNGYFGEVNNTCVQKCTLPNYANPLTKRCEPSCPPFGYLFAQNTTASCVTNCSIKANSYADRSINVCVSNCTLDNEYMLDGQAICTSLCPPGLFMQNSTKRCQAVCSTGFAEPTSRYCVARCFGNPQTYGLQGVCLYTCLNSTNSLYADNSTNLCVSPCPSTPSYFSDPLTGNCVAWCPDGYFSETSGRTCTTYCSTGFADNLTRSCVGTCPTASEQTYADSSTHRCVRICPQGSFADNATKTCLTNCTNNTWSDVISKYCVARCPSQPLTFGLNQTTTCVPRCPSTLFGDYQTQTCLNSCPTANNSEYRFADPISQTCVFVCPIFMNLYGDTSNFSCVGTCSNSQYRDNSTQRCVVKCPSQPNYWADPLSFNCVYRCPSTYFASNQTDRLCVKNCSTYSTFGDINARTCTAVCGYNYWADNSTYLCVEKCPSTPDMFADNVTKSCVYYCPKGSNWTTFADSTTRKCVTECPSGLFAQNSTQRCVQKCPNNTYADPIIRVCVQDCTVRPHYYKTNVLTCVFECPTIPDIAYKLDTNHTCVYTDPISQYTGCPANFWADPINNTCTQLCRQTYFADQVKHLCVKNCPIGTFADPADRLCKGSCSLAPEEYRLDVSPGVCVQFCPSPYFADNSTYNCVERCPNATVQGAMYSYEITRTCVLACPPPYFSYFPDSQCRLGCPSGYFAQDSTRSCEPTCQAPYFADDSTNQCVLTCPSTPNYYGYLRVCRGDCPVGFADNSTRMCVSSCPTQPQTFADNSTNKCVFNCPSTPNYYADNTTMVCVRYCPAGLFAETTTRTCVMNCPSYLMTYADPTTGVCQSGCPSPYFASDLTKQCVQLCPNTPVKTYAKSNGSVCVTKCPAGTFAQNISRTCAADCALGGSNSHADPSAYADINSNVCVSTCPYGWFGNNDTFACTQNCPQGTYADNYTRRCLAVCSGTQRLYADASTMQCVSTCPVTSYGNDQNWTCIVSCPSTVYGYKLDLARLCIKQCPSPYFAYVSTRTCVTDCGAGFYGHSATRICTACPSTCPTCVSLTQCLTCSAGLYLSFGSCEQTCPVGVYANNASMSCVYAISCPSGTYGNNDTSSCSSVCPTKQYPNKASRMCQNCPFTCASCQSTDVCSTCILNAAFSSQTKQCYQFCSPTQQYNFNGTCYSACPDGTYLDYTNVNCQQCNSICKTCSLSATNCTSCSSTYLYNLTCRSQCPTNYYGSNGTCLVCTPTAAPCKSPLTFTLQQKVEDYKTVVYVVFSEATSVNGNVKDIISLNVNPRLLQGSVVNGGVSYTSEVMADGTIKLTLSPGVTLSNPTFTVSINNPSLITTASGQSLQSLQAQVDNVVITNYPAGSTKDSPLIVAGTVLSVFLLILLFAIFLCTPLPTFLTIEAFQMIAFYALVVQLPPNLFYFMQQLSLSRLSFLPNIFNGVYKPMSKYSPQVPTRVIDLDEALSFSLTAGSYFFVLLLYAFISLVIVGISSKYNSNRPLRELFIKVRQTRVKWGILNDFLWMFAINVFVGGFMQFMYTENGGDVGVAIISLLIFIGILVVMFIHHVKTFNTQEEDSVNNYRFLHEGIRDGPIYRYTPFVYYLRKILFAIFIVATIKGTAKGQCIALIVLSSFMLVFLVILRPYQDKLRNFIHILHEIGLTFLGGAMLYYQHYVQILEPVGTKIMCGTIITSVIIFHLSVALIWGYFKAYTFYKELYKDFKKTEFFHLYLDEKYDESIEKELQDLNDETGEVQSVEMTSVAGNEENEEQNIIKLKIKRRRKIKKQAEPAIQVVPRNQGEYIRVEHFEPEPSPKLISVEKYEKLNLQDEIVPSILPQHQNKSQISWEQMGANNSQRPKSRENIFEPVLDREEQFTQIHKNQVLGQSAFEFQQISSVSNKQQKVSKQEGEHLRQSLQHIDQAINNEDNIYEQEQFEVQENVINVQPRDQQLQEAYPIEQPQKKQEEKVENIEDVNNMNILQDTPLQHQNEYQPEEKREESKANMNLLEVEPEQRQNEGGWQQMSQLHSKKEQVLDNLVINLDEQPNHEQAQSVKKEQQQEEENNENKNKNKVDWNIEDLLVQEENKGSRKNHLLLFDDQDFE